MTLPLIKPAPVSQNSDQYLVENRIKKLANGFFLNEDGTASKAFLSGGKELKITVFFPPNCTEAEKNARVESFNDQKLKVIGDHARALGLGSESKKKNSTVNAINFKHDGQGKLVEAEKHFANGKIVILNEAFYAEKIKKNPAKKAMIEKKLDNFKKIQLAWSNVQNPKQVENKEIPLKKTDKKEENAKKLAEEEKLKKEAEERTKLNEKHKDEKEKAKVDPNKNEPVKKT